MQACYSYSVMLLLFDRTRQLWIYVFHSCSFHLAPTPFTQGAAPLGAIEPHRMVCLLVTFILFFFFRLLSPLCTISWSHRSLSHTHKCTLTYTHHTGLLFSLLFVSPLKERGGGSRSYTLALSHAKHHIHTHTHPHNSCLSHPYFSCANLNAPVIRVISTLKWGKRGRSWIVGTESFSFNTIFESGCRPSKRGPGKGECPSSPQPLLSLHPPSHHIALIGCWDSVSSKRQYGGALFLFTYLLGTLYVKKRKCARARQRDPCWSLCFQPRLE